MNICIEIFSGVVRVELVENPGDYIPAVLAKVKKEYLARTYRIPSDWTNANEFLEKLAQKSGKLLKGGEPDINTVAKMILNGKYSHVPINSTVLLTIFGRYFPLFLELNMASYSGSYIFILYEIKTLIFLCPIWKNQPCLYRMTSVRPMGDPVRLILRG